MAYISCRRHRVMRALGALQSQPAGAEVWKRALTGLGDITEYGTMVGGGAKTAYRSMAPRLYGAMQGVSLGTDEDQARTATAMQNIHTVLEGAVKVAEKQKWLQLAATLSIPLAAYIWRAILKKRGSATEGITG